MKIKSHLALICGLFMALLPFSQLLGQEQEDPIKSHPGYLGLEEIIVGLEHYVTLEFDVGPLSAKLGSILFREKEPEFAEVLATIKFIHTIEFSMDEADESLVLSKANALFDKLATGDWNSLVKIRTEDSKLQVSVLMNSDGVIHALALVSLEDDNLTIVNLGGDLDLTKIVRLGEHYNIRELEDLGELINE
jgi:hypothetical protein